MVAKLTPERKPRHGAVLDDAVGVERGHELPQGRVAVAVLAYEAADGALAQFVEVILQMADGAIDGAGQGVIGRKRNLPDPLDGAEQGLLRITGHTLHFRDAGRL